MGGTDNHVTCSGCSDSESCVYLACLVPPVQSWAIVQPLGSECCCPRSEHRDRGLGQAVLAAV